MSPSPNAPAPNRMYVTAMKITVNVQSTSRRRDQLTEKEYPVSRPGMTLRRPLEEERHSFQNPTDAIPHQPRRDIRVDLLQSVQFLPIDLG